MSTLPTSRARARQLLHGAVRADKFWVYDPQSDGQIVAVELNEPDFINYERQLLEKSRGTNMVPTPAQLHVGWTGYMHPETRAAEVILTITYGAAPAHEAQARFILSDDEEFLVACAASEEFVLLSRFHWDARSEGRPWGLRVANLDRASLGEVLAVWHRSGRQGLSG